MRRALLPWGPGGQLATAGTGLLVSGRGCVTYSAAWETTGAAAAAVTLYDGGSANGQVLARYDLTASESISEQVGPHRLIFEEGLYVATVSGSVAGTLTVLLDHHCVWWLVAPQRAAELEAAWVLEQLGGGAGG